MIVGHKRVFQESGALAGPGISTVKMTSKSN